MHWSERNLTCFQFLKPRSGLPPLPLGIQAIASRASNEGGQTLEEWKEVSKHCFRRLPPNMPKVTVQKDSQLQSFASKFARKGYRKTWGRGRGSGNRSQLATNFLQELSGVDSNWDRGNGRTFNMPFPYLLGEAGTIKVDTFKFTTSAVSQSKGLEGLQSYHQIHFVFPVKLHEITAWNHSVAVPDRPLQKEAHTACLSCT